MKNHLIVLYVMLIAVIAFTIYNYQADRTAYVNPAELYEAFGMRKELESKLMVNQQQKKNMLDSLMTNMQSLQVQLSQEKHPANEQIKLFELMQRDYMLKQEQFQRENEEMTNKYVAEIYGHINEYVAEYGRTKGYKYIYGANGQGSLMYAEEGDNITSEVIIYINERYNGSAKK